MIISNEMPKLEGEQCRVLYLPRYSNQIVLGIAGSGKSLEALYRAAWIRMSNFNDKMVILSFNRSVIEDIGRKLNNMVQEKNQNNIYVGTIYNYFNYLINKYDAKEGSELAHLKKAVGINRSLKALYPKTYVKNTLDEAISKIKGEFGDSTLWNKADYDVFIQSELDWMMDNAIPYDDIDAYLSAERIGRGNNKLSQDQRRVMYRIYQKFNDIRMSKYHKLFSFNDIYRLIPDLDIPESEKPKYMIIDEVQDVSPSMFNAMRYVKSDEGYWNVFGDLAQNIFGQRVSWSKMLGININKIYRFDFNYRNNHEIGEFSSSILNYIHRLQDDDVENKTKLSNRHGEKPIITNYNDSDQLYSTIQRLSNNSKLLIITMNGYSEERFYKWFQKQWGNDNNVKLFSRFDNYIHDANNTTNILIQSINQVKGLEFDNVIVLGMDSSNDLIDRNEIINKQDHTLLTNNLDEEDKLKIVRRIYVAASRAKNNLVMFYKKSPLEFLLKELGQSYELRR